MPRKHPIRLGLACLLIDRGPCGFDDVLESLSEMYPGEKVINVKDVTEHIQSLLAVGFVESRMEDQRKVEVYYITEYGREKVARLT